MFGPGHAGRWSVDGKSVGSVLLLVGMVTGAFLTERYSGANVLLLFGLIQKEAKRSGTSNRPARKALFGEDSVFVGVSANVTFVLRSDLSWTD